MFLRLSSLTDDKLSYRIVKHPDNTFHDNLKDGMQVKGFWFLNEYHVEVTHDEERMLKLCRKLNMANYHDEIFWTPNPHNLTGYKRVFSSILRGDMNYMETGGDELHHYRMTIGPVVIYSVQLLIDMLSGLNIDCINLDKDDDDNAPFVIVLELQTTKRMMLSEFLQKIYIIMYSYNYKKFLGKVSNDKFEQLKRYVEKWIHQAIHKDKIIERLANRQLYSLYKIDEEYGNNKVKKIESTLDKSLHTNRHNFVRNYVDKTKPDFWIDLGCARGSVAKGSEYIDKYYGFDANLRGKNQVRRLKTNILYPLVPEDLLNIENKTVLSLIEVIEHFDKEDRLRLINLIIEYWQPDNLVITTPNFYYNKNYGLEGYRHRDHKIEYTIDTLHEILDPLSTYYDIKLASLDNTHDYLEQSSFVIVGKRVAPKHKTSSYHVELRNIFNMSKRMNLKINSGLCHNAMIKNMKNLFYLGPTIAPADSHDGELESLEKGLNYFKERGVSNVIAQEKIMGSRCYILWYRTLELANKEGYGKRFITNSRNGFRFFDDNIDELLCAQLDKALPKDVNMIMLDTEVTPWSYKAKDLINRDFLLPLLCEYHQNVYTAKNTLNVWTTINALSYHLNSYKSPNDIDVHIFDIQSVMSSNYYYITDLMNIISDNTKMFKSVTTWYVNNELNIIENFLNNSKNEGIVLKPMEWSKNAVSALKVRNRDFLRVIYGTNYDSYYEVLAQRDTRRKRRKSHNQKHLSTLMLEAFSRNDKVSLMQYLALFLNNDENEVVDNTL